MNARLPGATAHPPTRGLRVLKRMQRSQGARRPTPVMSLRRKVLPFPSTTFTVSGRQLCGNTYTRVSLKFRGKKTGEKIKKVYKISCLGDKGSCSTFLIKILGALIQLSWHNSNATHVNSYMINHQLSNSLRVRANGKISNHSIRM